jgi:hypothetical protein
MKTRKRKSGMRKIWKRRRKRKSNFLLYFY